MARDRHISVLAKIAEAAYRPYVKRLGKRPMPMDADFACPVARRDVYLLINRRQVEGYIVSYARELDQFVENLAVDPTAQGAGAGVALMAHADDLAGRNKKQVVRLYTNEKMFESLRFYLNLGYVETERRQEQGFRRIYLEKRL